MQVAGVARIMLLLWLWRRPEAVAPIGPLAWEPPYAMGAAPEKAKRHTHTHTHTHKRNIEKKKDFHVKESTHLYQILLRIQVSLQWCVELTAQSH